MAKSFSKVIGVPIPPVFSTGAWQGWIWRWRDLQLFSWKCSMVSENSLFGNELWPQRVWGPNLVFPWTCCVKSGIYLPVAHQRSGTCSDGGSLEMAKVQWYLGIYWSTQFRCSYVHYICRWHWIGRAAKGIEFQIALSNLSNSVAGVGCFFFK